VASVTFDGITKTYGDGTQAVKDLSLEIEDGELIVFVGPSGCGKTTALRMVAGLEEISSGEIRIGDRVVNDLDPRQRDIAMVFQNYALYPHMSVFDNMAFPLASQGVPRKEIKDRVERTAALLDLSDHLRRRPRNLSGGQRQRVAMGRALVREPQVFLMDEPLSNLDAKLRVQMRVEISRLQRHLDITTIYVTHDQVEAMTMGNRIVVMRKGVLQQLGAPQQLYDRPVNLFVATFVGSPAMNLFEATVQERADGRYSLELGRQTLELPAHVDGHVLRPYRGRKIALGVRPEHLLPPQAAGDNPRLRANIDLVEPLGSDRLVYVSFPGHPVVTEDVLESARDVDEAAKESLQGAHREGTVTAVARYDPEADAPVGAAQDIGVRADKMHFFELETGARI
jgi:multiple sugar transport system ATP-binding protein